MEILELTPFILTFNEEVNIGRCLQSLTWASQILVVDSGSTDRTLELLDSAPTVRVVQRPFDSHSNQANFALSLITTKWVLSLDADYILTPEFQSGLIQGRFPKDSQSVYFAPFLQCVNGHPLRRSLYPPRGVLYAREGAFYEQDGHTQRLSLRGRTAVLLREAILHDDRKSRERWLHNQHRYAVLEAAKLRSVPLGTLGWADRLRWVGFLAPILILPYVLIMRGLILNGWPGIVYAFQRCHVEFLLAWYLLGSRLRSPFSPESQP